MVKLHQPKREAFAQNLAQGMTNIQAYTEAGFRPNHGNASLLSRHPKIVARVEEIRKEIQRRLQPQDFDPDVVDRGWIIAELYQQVLMARDAGELKVANEALTQIAKITGYLANGPGSNARIPPGEKTERDTTIIAGKAKEVSDIHSFIERLGNGVGDGASEGDLVGPGEAEDTDGPDGD